MAYAPIRSGAPVGGLYLPGVSGSYASTPDAAALRITGDLDVRADVRPQSWRPASHRTIAARMNFGTNQGSYRFFHDASGDLKLQWSTNGTSGAQITAVSTAFVPNDAQRRRVRAVLDVDNGDGGYEVAFYTALPGEAWAQLGDTVVGGATTSVHAGTAPLEVGSRTNGTDSLYQGVVYSCEVRDGIDGTVVANPSFGAPVSAWTMAGATAWDGERVWTLNGNRWEWRP